MSEAEWGAFCREARLLSKVFPGARANAIFHASMSSAHRALMLPHFIEAITILAFQRANPDIGRNTAVAQAGGKAAAVAPPLALRNISKQYHRERS